MVIIGGITADDVMQWLKDQILDMEAYIWVAVADLNEDSYNLHVARRNDYADAYDKIEEAEGVRT